MRRLSNDLLVLQGEHTTAFFAKYQVEDVTIDPDGLGWVKSSPNPLFTRHGPKWW